ncbi:MULTISPECIES: DUF6063 family protein [unclassified Bacillus cereus group]|uniref:DUF6063 family protein n=1 Tax=unclassified Bacillus cereus group TaxID=2750818 RepID=UPI001F58CE3B|nr:MULTISPECIES: DUF6063 family protein [unclassified Bacillus cereus group]
MLNMESVEVANEIYSALLEKRALKDEDALVFKYKQNESARLILKNRCKVEGTEILLGKEYLHFVTKDGSLYSSAFSQMKEKYYVIENKRILHLIGLLHFVFFSEANTEITTSQIEWLQNGVSYFKLIEQADKVFKQLYDTQVKSNGEFSKKFSIAIDGIYHMWKDLDIDYSGRQRVTMNRKTKFGLVHTAMKILEDDGLVFIKIFKRNAEAVPTRILNERLDLQFNNNAKFHEIKNLISQIKDDERKGE